MRRLTVGPLCRECCEIRRSAVWVSTCSPAPCRHRFWWLWSAPANPNADVHIGAACAAVEGRTYSPTKVRHRWKTPRLPDHQAGPLARRLLAFRSRGEFFQLVDPGPRVGLLLGDGELAAVAAEEGHHPRQ